MPRLLPARFAAECIREFDRAADERYVDAEALAAVGRRTGAIYLHGYVVEMLLKAAYFRMLRFTDTQVIALSDLSAAVGTSAGSQARLLGLPGTRNYHNLGAWVELIITYRNRSGMPYAELGFAGELADRVDTVHARWTEVIRYHKNTAYAHELRQVRDASAWIMTHRTEL